MPDIIVKGKRKKIRDPLIPLTKRGAGPHKLKKDKRYKDKLRKLISEQYDTTRDT